MFPTIEPFAFWLHFDSTGILSCLGAGFGLAAAFFWGIAIVPLIGASFCLGAPLPKMDKVERAGAGLALGAGTD